MTFIIPLYIFRLDESDFYDFKLKFPAVFGLILSYSYVKKSAVNKFGIIGFKNNH